MVSEVIMKRRRNNRLLLLGTVFLGAVVLLVGVACDPAIPLQIENQTDMVLIIYVQNVKIGEVEPNNSIKVKKLGATGYYLIEAGNNKGEVVYSREFSFNELHDADWKVVIPPL
jgi:hypothetical protein